MIDSKTNWAVIFFAALIINFGGLYLGSLWTTPGVSSEWYTGLDQAPWTPPGWVFGAAWTTIGITFSVFISKILNKYDVDPIFGFLFFSSLAANIGWNALFFGLRWTGIAAFVIIELALNILLMIHLAKNEYGWKIAAWALPYFIWLCIATSLNLYIYIQN